MPKSPQDRHKVIPAVYVVFRDGEKILLIKRANTGYRDGYYSLPAGHVGGSDENGGESATQAATREAKEEVGVDIEINDLRLVHTLHRVSTDPTPHERMDLYFEAEKWRGEPKNAEPHKCDEIRWADINDLPKNVIPEVRQALANISHGNPYSDFGF
jgi:8-oxo-dGTP diphosphatase